MTTENEYNYELLGVIDILKSFGEATQVEIESYPSSGEDRFKELQSLGYIAQNVDDEGKKQDTYSLTQAALDVWNTKRTYGDTLHSQYQLTTNEFKILQALASQGPMTVAELVRSLNVDALRSGTRLRQIELVVITYREGRGSVFWEISGEQLEEIRKSLAVRTEDDYYRNIAVEVASLESVKDFRSSFTGSWSDIDADQSTDRNLISGNLFIVVELPSDSEAPAWAPFIKDLLEKYSTDKIINDIEINNRIYGYIPPLNFGVVDPKNNGRFEPINSFNQIDQPYIVLIHYREQRGLPVKNAVIDWGTDYTTNPPKTDEDSIDEDSIRIHLVSVLESSGEVVDTITLIDPYPVVLNPAQSFYPTNGMELEAETGSFSIYARKVISSTSECLKYGQELYDQRKKK